MSMLMWLFDRDHKMKTNRQIKSFRCSLEVRILINFLFQWKAAVIRFLWKCSGSIINIYLSVSLLCNQHIIVRAKCANILSAPLKRSPLYDGLTMTICVCCRMNGAVIKGYEEDVGNKTSVYVHTAHSITSSQFGLRKYGYTSVPKDEVLKLRCMCVVLWFMLSKHSHSSVLLFFVRV